MSAAPLAAVTGATGFLGRYIVSGLAARGWHVRILARGPADHPQLKDLTLETIRGDLSDRPALQKLVDGADVVIHSAGLVKARNNRDFLAANVDGTVNLARALNDARGGPRVLLVSSLAAREPLLSAYAASKRAGEEALGATLGSRADWVIVRPCAIYGPWDRQTLGFFRAVSRGLALRPRVPGARVALIHAADAASAIGALAERGPAGAVLEITDERPEGYSWAEITAAAAAAMEIKAISLSVPGLALRAAAAVNATASRALGRTPLFTPGKVREILHADWGSSLERQPLRELWRPTIELQQGFRDTMQWYRDRRWLAGRTSALAARGALH